MFWWLKRYIFNDSTRHFDVGKVSKCNLEIVDMDVWRTNWSKNGSNKITSSPGSKNPIKVLNIPSFAPLVMVTSVSGSILRPKDGE